jgi:hypothetical protein
MVPDVTVRALAGGGTDGPVEVNPLATAPDTELAAVVCLE